MFEATSIAAKKRLVEFLPDAGSAYAARRNYDYGADARDNVSALSPWIRLRVLPEWVIVAEVLAVHSASSAAKFIDEVCWRTYWKGWLQLRPTVWDAYLKELESAHDSIQENDSYHATIGAQSGIECMDAWTRELVDTGYLHNHARMWYASIWIHTLKLSWALGADFFLKHLLDGDAASNTLSWRWVAGLHTAGKTYLASASNIETYTAGRFSPREPLASRPISLTPDTDDHPIQPLIGLAKLPTEGRIGVLAHEEDLSAIDWLQTKATVVSAAGLMPVDAYQAHGIHSSVITFRKSCMTEALTGKGNTYTTVADVVHWATSETLQHVVMAEPSVGLWNSVTSQLTDALAEHNIKLSLTRHWWDDHFYPSARSGFFRFKKAIPSALDQLKQSTLKL